MWLIREVDSTCLRGGKPHAVSREIFPVVSEQVTHGHFIAAVGSSDTITVQVQGVLI